MIERSVIIAEDGRPNLERALPASSGAVTLAQTDDKVLTVAELQQLEKNNLLCALRTCGWRIAGDNGAAKLLGMKPSTLNSRISALGLKKPQA